MSDTPELIVQDAWLEPYSKEIQQRILTHQENLNMIDSEYGSLLEFADWHFTHGFTIDSITGKQKLQEWAPAAKQIELVGDFNHWDGNAHAFKKESSGIWSLTLPADTLQHGDLFKLRLTNAKGNISDKIPACIRRILQNTETRDFSAQVWNPTAQYTWENDFNTCHIKTPLIYEAHVGIAGEEKGIHSYTEFTTNTLPRIANLGYNIIQLMAVQEHPYYGSFGYHVSNYFAASSKFGTPEELKHLIDTAHGLGIAVLLDIVHSHSVKNTAEGLNNFDGSGHQYFKEGDAGDHPQWDSKCFDYSKKEVQQFLLSNVRFWLEEYHFDGFRFDGITSMLYHHHGDASFDHYDSYFKEGVDEDAINYLQLATTLAKQIKPNAILIAEDMSGMPGLCQPIEYGGIGFTHRLSMGIPDYWIKLVKSKKDQQWQMSELWEILTNRRYKEANISYVESHDQSIVGDKTMAFRLMDSEMYWSMSKEKRNFTIDRGLALHKMIRLITASAAGEGYLNFIGNEFGHPEWLDFPREGNDWSYQHCRRQWSLVDNPELCYHFLNDFDRAMIKLFKHYTILPEFGNTYERWLHEEDKVIAFNRGELMFLFNFHASCSHEDYQIPVPHPGEYQIILNSDSEHLGGHARVDDSVSFYSTLWEENKGHVIQCYLPTRTALVLVKK